MLPPRPRKIALTAHIAFSVGWLGAVVAFLGLAVAGLASQESERLRAAYLAMQMTGWSVIVPLSFASLATGVVSALGSKFGLFRHYWVLFKLVINIFANIALLIYMPTLDILAIVARDATRSTSGLDAFRDPSPVLHSSLALVLLLVATTLGVFKPRGLTPYGQRKLREERISSETL
jgi:hypothetical protein